MERKTTNSAKTKNHKEKLQNKRSQREFEELLLKDILMEVEMGDDDYWEKKSQEWADDPGRSPTPEQRAAFEERLELEVKRIQKQKRQEALARTHRRRQIMSMLKKVAMIVVFFAVFAGTFLYCTVDTFAAGVDRFISAVMVEDGAEELRLEEKKDGGLELDMADYVGMYMPEWIPKGYFVDRLVVDEHKRLIFFANESGDIICYDISESIYSVMLDDEDVTEEKVYLLDTWGRIITADDMVYVVWEDGDYIYTVSGESSIREKIIEMVERSVKIQAEN